MSRDEWLAQQEGRDDPVGDLARDHRDDPVGMLGGGRSPSRDWMRDQYAEDAWDEAQEGLW